MNNKAILLVNLGSPNSTEVSDVNTYLKEFLMDGRVIDMSYLIRYFVVNFIIVPFRAAKSALKYKKIWTEEGSPLIFTAKKLAKKLAKKSGLPTYYAMRYGNPYPGKIFEEILKDNKNTDEVIVFLLYPHYAMSSYETAAEYIKNIHKESKYSFKINIIPPFFSHKKYIESLSESIKPYTSKEYDHIVFSYHGIPERHIKKSDYSKSHCLIAKDCCNKYSDVHNVCYRHQILKTTEMVTKKLNIPKEKYSFSFQSRLGRDKWLLPFTSEVLKEYPQKGIKNLLIVTPAFVADCLETLEEIGIEGKETFREAGGDTLVLIPCLNTRDDWVDAVWSIIRESI